MLALAEPPPRILPEDPDALLGVHAGIPEDVYHASPGVSVSRLKRFAKAAAKAFTQQEETAALRFGTLIHAALLEPGAVNARFIVSDLSRNSNAFKELRAEADARGLTIVKQADYDEAMRLRDAVMAQPVARDILAPGLLAEQSFWWRDEATGLLCRGRTDLVRPEPGWRALVDIKSTEDASAEAFARTIARYQYQLQAAHYEDGWAQAAGWKPELLLFLAVEKEPPYLCQAFEIDTLDMAAARDDLRALLDAYAECERTGEWPGYPDGIRRISLPGWARL